MRKIIFLAALLAAMPAKAAQFEFSGYADLRVVAASTNERSWLKGGLGKLRYGKSDSEFQFADAVGQGSVLITPDLLLTAVARAGSQQKTGIDLLESYLRYRPVSITRWRWSVKAGAFFVPFSLENTEIGWAPYWTLTPSAINSWYGDELRSVGGEFALEWRREAGTLKMTAALFGWNDPAGVIIADRGWALGDLSTGLFEHLREPDATLLLHGDTPPDSTPLFTEFDNRPGWYAGASWEDAGQWRLQVFRYDNEADPRAHQDDYFAWRTKFWDAGFSDQVGEFTILAQAVTGNTEIAPSPTFRSTTDFDSAFALLGWQDGEWRIAGRAEYFHTRSHNSFGASPATSENGYAFTAVVSWLPNDWLKLTGELLSVSSTRGERSIEGLDPHQTQVQFQLAARVYLDRWQ